MKPQKYYGDKFYRVLNVKTCTLIVMCVVLEGLVRDTIWLKETTGLVTVGD